MITLLAAAVAVGPVSPAYAGVAYIPSLTIQPKPGFDATQQITLQAPGDNVTFEAPNALGKYVGGAYLRLPDGSYQDCSESSSNEVWSCGNVHDGLVVMTVNYHADSLVGNAEETYPVKVGLTNNQSSSAGYGTRAYSSGQVTVKAGYQPTANLKITSFRVETASAIGAAGTQSAYGIAIANAGPQKTRLTLTVSGLGSTKLLTSDPTCTRSTNYVCVWTLASGETVQYGLNLAGSADTLHLSLTATVKGDLYDANLADNRRTLTLPIGGNGSGTSGTTTGTSGGTTTSDSSGTQNATASASTSATASGSVAPSDSVVTTTPADGITDTPTGTPSPVATAAPGSGSTTAVLVAVVALLLLGAAGAFLVARRRRASASDD
ncbi:MAG: hypothetical protein HOV71_30185 [Hamadaea sp.]|nr:hypothetical protein [Hamadaea sp.]NUT04660.1 hypothetical protein [Hamadaea sp.]